MVVKNRFLGTCINRLCSLCCRCITDPAYEDVNNAFERALVFLHKVRMHIIGPVIRKL